MEEETIIVYCKVDEQRRITEVNSSIFLEDVAGWLELDRSDSGSRSSRDAYAHAQGNYFPDGLVDDTGAHRYLYNDNQAPKYRQATAEEMQAERDALPKPPAMQEQIDINLLDLDYRMTLLENGVKENDLV
ncbi:MAG: hypothetical protein HFG20_05745 [Anaerotruncus sp.]|nr:hypothetical protein [Anaerotruncus sp.]